jgi:monoamine oxidase
MNLNREGIVEAQLKSPWDYRFDDYMNILTGATPLNPSSGQRIAIIGGGMSGLVAACLLKRAGHQITIFEAKHVVGGRVKTLRERFTSNFYAEAGAMRIPDHHRLTKWMAYSVFGLGKPMTFINKNDDGIIYINNQRTTFAEYNTNPNVLKFSLQGDEVGKPAAFLFDTCLENYITKLPGDATTKFDWKTFKIEDLYCGASQMDVSDIKYLMGVLDRYSLRYFLSYIAKFNDQPLSQGAIDMISAVLVYEMELSCSMAFIISQTIEFNAEGFTQIPGGMDRLPKSFVRGVSHSLPKTRSAGSAFPDLSEEVYYNCRVKEITKNGSDLKVQFENTNTSYEGDLDFHRVVICVPFSALRHIRIMKGLTSPEKRRAIRQLHYANACKVLLEFKNAFWTEKTPDRSPIDGGKSITDLALRQIFYPSPGQNDHLGRGLLLASYTWGDDSLRWTSLKPDDRIRFALRDLERVYGARDTLKSLCIGGMSHSWAEDEFTSGAFAQFEPDQMTKLFPAVWQPEGRLHYAGEHTSIRYGWIEGAIESGVRAADEICRSISTERAKRTSVRRSA